MGQLSLITAITALWCWQTFFKNTETQIAPRLYIFSQNKSPQQIFIYFYNNSSWRNNTFCSCKKKALKAASDWHGRCWWAAKCCRWVTALTRSVQVAVVLSFSSISFPIFCTVTWVCLMALWAVWSLQEEENTKSPSRSLFVTTQTTPYLNSLSERPPIWVAVSALWQHQWIISLSLDVYSDCLESIVNYDFPQVEESLCSVFVMPRLYFWFIEVDRHCSRRSSLVS